jgi:hypothetical protein
MSIGAGVRDMGGERFTSFDERFAGDRDTKKSISEIGYRLASLATPGGPKALVDASSVLALSSGAGILLSQPSDSFAERFDGERNLLKAAYFVRPPELLWVVQLIGDSSEAIALSRFRQLQNKHQSILGIYTPLVVNTTLKPGAQPIWTRVRIGLDTRQAADSLCEQLEAAGERCVVQRNANIPSSI